MDHWQRLFTYITGAFVIGLLLIVFTNSFLHFVNAEAPTGYIALLGYGLIYLNLGYGVNRRFTLKADRPPVLNYFLSSLMVTPTLFWAFTKDEGLGDSLVVFAITIVFAVFLGTYFGRRKGNARRETYLRQIYEEGGKEDLPGDLKRSHDDLSKN